MREEIYPICLFPSADIQGLVDENELTHVDSLLDSVHVVLSALSYIDQSGRYDANSHCGVLSFRA